MYGSYPNLFVILIGLPSLIPPSLTQISNYQLRQISSATISCIYPCVLNLLTSPFLLKDQIKTKIKNKAYLKIKSRKTKFAKIQTSLALTHKQFPLNKSALAIKLQMSKIT